MKKLSLIMLLSMFTLAACGTEETIMYIKPSEFSGETTKVLGLFDDELYFFDFVVDETVKSKEIVFWVYENNKWIEAGKVYGNVGSLEQQLILSFRGMGCEIHLVDETGSSAFSYPQFNTDFDSALSVGWTSLSYETEIELNQEIPIYIKTGTDKMDSHSMADDFRTQYCTTGLAVTVTFSDKIVD
ncbi:MAG: hypothetical protein ATN34_02690 [Epulopiscium sp. Nele67-Bin002]|nr:MAG: hypothetical protein BEN18_00645 [Epulopiscium sp. Nuni2H_MBin001]OON90889.1 MAG: hypothetical protein ATN33_02045 [Epulopiscium sp. Nele67-Bin001]OON91696.1 MAG: hypothetical protein ATN34_02690 [Epulopiscium sp. Nele67-Bin002]